MSKQNSSLKKNWVEWLVFGLGLVLVLVSLGGLTFHALTLRGEPAVLELRLGDPRAVRQGGTHFLVSVAVTNRGDRSVEQVRIEVLLEANGRSERRELELDSLPRHAERSGWVSFEHDPRQGAMRGRVVSYRDP